MSASLSGVQETRKLRFTGPELRTLLGPRGSRWRHRIIFNRSSSQEAQRRRTDQLHPRAASSTPSVTGLVWASLDMLTIFVASIMALRLQLGSVAGAHGSFSLISQRPAVAPPSWPSTCSGSASALVFITRSYGLYGPIQNRSGLHEQRVTVQATLTAGLLLCGALYIGAASTVPRTVVVYLVLITAALLCVRRAVWRRMDYSRYREGSKPATS